MFNSDLYSSSVVEDPAMVWNREPIQVSSDIAAAKKGQGSSNSKNVQVSSCSKKCQVNPYRKYNTIMTLSSKSNFSSYCSNYYNS